MKKYDTYKASGIEWIGEIPSHWDVIRFKYCFQFVNDKIDADLPKIGLEHIESWTGKLIENDSDYEGDGTYFRRNDILFGKLRPYLAKVYLSKIEGKAVGDFFVFRSSKAINPKYGHKLLLSRNFIDLTNSSTFGSKMPRVSPDFIAELKTIIPPIEEQSAIAHYLDRKTAEIDELIADKKRLLELYEEEKTAIINQAVTKGINPDVPMKDSGIEWLGEIPEHWEVKKIGNCSKIVRGGSPRPSGDPRYFMGDYIHWITVKEVTNAVGRYVVGTEEYLTEDGSKNSRIIEPETLLLSNSGATLGVPKISKIRGCINDGSVAFPELKPFLNRDYLYYFFESHTDIYREQMAGNGQPNLNTEIIKSTFITLPSTVEEQIAIVEYIEIETQKVIAKKTKTEKLIELLTDYRTALISEVVTGKVKVIE